VELRVISALLSVLCHPTPAALSSEDGPVIRCPPENSLTLVPTPSELALERMPLVSLALTDTATGETRVHTLARLQAELTLAKAQLGNLYREREHTAA
jgi:hypothetical protein